MRRPGPLVVLVSVLWALCVVLPTPLEAYGGPGSIVSGIGALIAVVAAVLAAAFGFVWFPLKRLYRYLRGADPEEEGRGLSGEGEAPG